MMIPGLIRPDELAKRLGVPPVTVYSWVRRGKIPYLKIESCVRVDPLEIELWIESKRRVARAEDS